IAWRSLSDQENLFPCSLVDDLRGKFLAGGSQNLPREKQKKSAARSGVSGTDRKMRCTTDGGSDARCWTVNVQSSQFFDSNCLPKKSEIASKNRHADRSQARAGPDLPRRVSESHLTNGGRTLLLFCAVLLSGPDPPVCHLGLSAVT